MQAVHLLHAVYLLFFFANSTVAHKTHPAFLSFQSSTLLSRESEIRQPRHVLQSSRNDQIVSGVAQFSIGASLCVFWSEYTVMTTGCGPLILPDFLERACYQLDIASAGAFLFSRIAFSRDITTILQEEEIFVLEKSTLTGVRWAERLAFGTVLGAILSLVSQVANGSHMDGMSGIDLNMCKSLRDFNDL